MKNDRNFPQNLLLRNARLERGLSQSKLAEMLNTSPVSISRWENGSSFPSPSFRPQLSEILGKKISELGLLPPEHNYRIVNILNTRNLLFTGREALLVVLHERLTAARKVALPSAQALYGLGGIGKTQTAAEYAFRYSDEYENIFWIRAATRETLVADFLRIAQQLDLLEKDEHDSSRIVLAVKHWLAVHSNWLLILDNADELPLAQEFVPNSHKGCILLTTRASATGAFAASIEVEKLSLQESTLLLLRQSKLLDREDTLDNAKAADRVVAERILNEMDGLPLAIAQVGAYVEETGCSLTDYLHLYAPHRKDLLARRSFLILDYTETVYTTWSLSFQHVEQRSAAAADVLCLCAFLAPDAIPEEILTRGAIELGTPTRAVVMNPLRFNEMLEVLRGYSLVRRNRDTYMLNIHRLVQTVLKEGMNEEMQRMWAERTVRVVNAAFSEGNYGVGASQQYYLQYYLPHIQECATLIERYSLNFLEAAQLLYSAGAFLYAHGLYSQSQSLHEQALSIRKQLVGSEHSAVAESFNS